MNSLYELSQEYINALDSIEIDEDTGLVLNMDALIDIDDALEKKAEAVALYIKDLIAFYWSLAGEINKQKRRLESTESKITSLKAYLSMCLAGAGKDKIETEKTRISFRKSTAVVIHNEAAIPRDYIIEKVTSRVNKEAIKKAIAEGKTVQGAHIEDRKNIQIV